MDSIGAVIEWLASLVEFVVGIVDAIPWEAFRSGRES
jgi:hypothetical protein